MAYLTSMVGMHMPLLEMWLYKHGEGSIAPGSEESLRGVLVKSLLQCRSEAAADKNEEVNSHDSFFGEVVKSEVDLFVRNGKISPNNLLRLQAKIVRRIRGSETARGDSRRKQLENQGSQSARVPKQRMGTPDWRDIGDYMKLQASDDAIRYKQKRKDGQVIYREELAEQVDAKSIVRQGRRDEDMQRYLTIKKDIENFEQREKEKKVDSKKRELLIVKDLDEQAREVKEIQSRARQDFVEDERQQLRKNAEEIKQEKQKEVNYRKKAREVLMTQLQDAKDRHSRRNEERQKRHEYERFKVKEFEELFDEQRMRNKKIIPQNRGADQSPQPLNYRGYSEEDMMRILAERTRLSEEADQRKDEKRREIEEHHLKFLGEQIEERKRQRAAKDRPID